MSWGGVMADHLGWGIIEEGWRKGPWTAEEDRLLIEYVKLHGEGRWNSVARLQGLYNFILFCFYSYEIKSSYTKFCSNSVSSHIL